MGGRGPAAGGAARLRRRPSTTSRSRCSRKRSDPLPEDGLEIRPVYWTDFQAVLSLPKDPPVCLTSRNAESRHVLELPHPPPAPAGDPLVAVAPRVARTP